MPRKPKTERKKDAKRLASGIRETSQDAAVEHGGKSSAGSGLGGNAGGTADDARSVSPLARLIQSLGEEEIRFQIVGMVAAIMQGVVATTLDVDIWVDLPERQYVRIMNICVKQGATALAPTLYVLADGRVVNFLFSINGIGTFEAERKHTTVAKLEGEDVPVLALDRILKSKKTILRDKDKLHILLIERVLKAEKKLKEQ